MAESETTPSRLKLRHALFVLLLLSGIIPLVISNVLQIRQSRALLETEERTALTEAAESLSREVGTQLDAARRQLSQLGDSVLQAPRQGSLEERLRADWLRTLLSSIILDDPNLIALQVVDTFGTGQKVAQVALPPGLESVRGRAIRTALGEAALTSAFGVLEAENQPVASLAISVDRGERGEVAVEGLYRLPLSEVVFRRETEGEVGIFLIAGDGKVLWTQDPTGEGVEALETSNFIQNFVQRPLAMTTEYPVATSDGNLRMLAQVSPIPDTGWAVVVQKPTAAAFKAINRIVLNALLASALLVALALGFAVFAARWVGRPIQRLAEASHDIAEGGFARRVDPRGLSFEMVDLAHDFNRMGDHVQDYIARLEESARANQELFIGSIRAFAAAIDAKDPYTRGHSERVASVSRIIARHLSLPDDFQHQVWVGALLHDVGKIGVEDEILKKTGGFTEEEYEQMKLHTVIGAEIMSPIEQLRKMIPAIRWHHEAWNGRGYPDGKKGQEIPLIARIVAVADTFDAITTNRPYQRAYSLEDAIATVTRLTGSRFDAKVVTAFLRAHEKGEISIGDPGDEVETITGPVDAAGAMLFS